MVRYVRPFPVRPGRRRMRSVHSHAPWRSSGSFGCIRPIPVCPECRQVRSGAFSHSRTPGGSYNAFGPFPRSLGVLGFVRVRSVRSLAPWGSSGSFVCVQSIPVRLGDRQVCLCAFGPLPCGKGVFVWVRSIPIHLGRRHVRPWGRRVRSGAFGTFPCPLSLVPTPLHLI